MEGNLKPETGKFKINKGKHTAVVNEDSVGFLVLKVSILNWFGEFVGFYEYSKDNFASLNWEKMTSSKSKLGPKILLHFLSLGK